MGSWSPAKLLCLSVLGHLVSLLAGQHFSMNKCTHECPPLNRDMPQIPNHRLKNYTETSPSCRPKAVIFITVRNKIICAHPDVKWVQEAIRFLDESAAAQKMTGGKEDRGKFEKLTGVTGPPTTQVDGGESTVPATTLVPKAANTPVSTTISPSPSPTPAFSEEEMALTTSPGLPASIFSSSVSFSDSLLVGSTSSMTGEKNLDAVLVFQGTETSSIKAISTRMTPILESSDSGPLAKGEISEEMPTISYPGEEVMGKSEDHSEPVEERDFTTENPIISEEASTVLTLTNPFSNLATDVAEHYFPVSIPASESPNKGLVSRTNLPSKFEEPAHATVDPQRLEVAITAIPDSPQAATRRQAFGLLAFLGFLFCLGVAMFAYQSLQSCPRRMAGEVVEGLRYIPRSCGSNSYVLVPV
ncbi:fractalkine [Gracilinanus agilis]|uniref:fractalkine n=1 Tax=Gracilinanus agilis TaxID=191870 RepID=UPI001CFCA9FA|nr:fractalkine [Gracilinanus agilis]